MSKWKSILITVGILAFGFVVSAVFSNQPGPRQNLPEKEEKNKFPTVQIKNETINNSVATTGRVHALNKIELYAEVSGLLEQNSMKFKAGNSFKKGETLVSIDDGVYKNNLLAQKSNLLNQITLLIPDLSFDFPESADKWEKYLSDFDFNSPLKPLPEPTEKKEKYYLAAKNIFNLYYSIKSMEATWEKYTIEAPFNGVVTESNLNPGTLVRNGQKLGEFISNDIYEVEVAVSPEKIKFINVGKDVDLQSQDETINFSGRINRVNSAIDQQSQMVMVYVRSSDRNLKDGMYVTVKFNGTKLENVAKIPRSSVTKGNMVYVANESGYLSTEVKIISSDGNFILVEGLKDGEVILAEQSDYKEIHHSQSVSMN